VFKLARKAISPIYAVYQRRLESQIMKGEVPNHLAVIMDGNRRYAESVGLLPHEGHLKGKNTLENLSDWCRSLGIKILTVYAFSLENFNTSPPNSNVRNKKSLEQAYEVAKNYVKSPEGWLTFFGPTGVGKTHLAISIFMKLKAKGREATFVFVPDMLDELRNSYSENTDNYVPKFNYIKDAKILILDDFGSGNYSSWAFEKLYQIITWRYNRKLPTVITSPNDFGKRHDAMISRIQDPLIGQMIKIESTDFRVKGKR